ncbi:glycosyltransferase family 4 protein [Agitococcus lubricus]|uniref:Glycosyltransferase involved in cell wall biosynthesis n=1 Tax=Agitococcus lubricus TaxID=1077255 RepID=A0A2T5J111_9GAMM|nr:glycosyltransferase family 4 protein [Agitococcus lubricus]PTQ90024.1 glycosyltransferase involved in cell wall biosynthesis [Agitococcus lubricus]
MKKLTVVQTLPALNAGGVERGTLEIGRALVAAGHRSIVISSGGRLVAQLEAEGSEHITLPVHRKTLSSLWQVGAFRHIIQDLQPDILHARSRVPAWIAWLAWRKLAPNQRPHFVTTVHGLYSVNFYSAIMTKGEKVIAVSHTVKDYILKNYPHCPAERIQVIYRGVSSQEFPYNYQPSATWLAQWQQDYPQLQGKTVLTLPGRITRWKGQREFIELIEQLVSKNYAVHGLIVGGAEAKKQAYLEELKQLIAAKNLSAHISLTGHRSDMREIFSQSHLTYSLSTDPEAFGRTALEALYIGTPVIGWNHGGVGETLSNCYPQGRVSFGDTDSLLAKTEQLLQSPERPQPTNALSLRLMCDSTLAIYQQLVG